MRGIEVLQLKKYYNKNKVVDVDYLELELGKAYGLVGTNGAGKTTLLKLLSGGLKIRFGEVKKEDLSIQMIHHGIGLFQEMKVYENVFLNREYKNRVGPLEKINWKKVKKATKDLLLKYDLKVLPYLPVKKVDMATQKLLEIVIAISKEPDVLIIDEPLTLLDHQQIEFLGTLLSEFMNDNRILIYSSHRVDEIVRVVDEIITMRDGQIIGKMEATKDHIMSLWEFSEKDIHKYPKRQVKIGKDLLKVANLKSEHLKGIRFDLFEGEILGIVGLKGSYKSDIGRAVFGAISYDGRIYINGRLLKNRTTAKAVELGICYVGHSQEGLFIEDSVYDNVVAANDKRSRKLSSRAKKRITKYYLDLLNIGSNTMGGRLSNLSAGNKQKVLLAKWFFSNSKVFIFNKPTANVDVPSKVDIYNIFSDLAETGAGLIIISNDLEEVAGLCDRVLVVSKGKIQQEILRKDLSVHNIVTSLQNWG